MLLEHVDRATATATQIALASLAGGAREVELPDFDRNRADFDAALIAEPEPEGTDRTSVLRRALGLHG